MGPVYAVIFFGSNRNNLYVHRTLQCRQSYDPPMKYNAVDVNSILWRYIQLRWCIDFKNPTWQLKIKKKVNQSNVKLEWLLKQLMNLLNNSAQNEMFVFLSIKCKIRITIGAAYESLEYPAQNQMFVSF